MTAFTINLICMIVYLIVGFIIFIITVILYSCDDGSCSCGDCVIIYNNIISLDVVV